jgi:hypothetical protein
MIENQINQIVLWGHKLHSHTHSYIHYAFIKAFTHLGYKTLWFDKNDDVSQINFDKSLFITEGQVDENIPLKDDCFYVLHNCNFDKYRHLPRNNFISLQVYTNTIPKHSTLIENSCYYCDDCIFIPWGTDLLPHEVQENINKVKNDEITYKNPKALHFIGMPLYPWDLALEYCVENNIKYRQKGGFSNNATPEENMKLIQESYLAPAIQCKWQVDNHYVPCRIFKNISYGKMGITNNEYVYNLFHKKILYDENVKELMQKGVEFEERDSEYKKNVLIPLMEDVRDNHTYINRIKCIFFLLNKIHNS